MSKKYILTQIETNPTGIVLPLTTLASPPQPGALEFDGTNLYTTTSSLTRKAIPGVLFSGISSKTVTNTSVLTSVLPTGVGSLLLPPNFWKVGKTVRLTGGGVYSTPAVTPGTATIRINNSAITLASVVTSTLLAGATNRGFQFEAIITCRSVGSQGQMSTTGNISYATTTGRVFDDLNSLLTPVAVDTTVSNTLDVSVQWDTASASKSVTVTNALVEILN